MMLKNKRIVVGPTDFVALLVNLIKASKDPKIGFEHVSNDVYYFLRVMAPGGVELDEAFVEDMLSACQLLKEHNKFEHPTNKVYEKFVQDVIGRHNTFDNITCTINKKD